MKKLILASLILMGFSIKGFSQEEEMVKQVVRNMFTAMKNADVALLKSCFSDSAILQTIVVSKEGKVSVRTDAVSAFLQSISKLPKGAADERIEFEKVHVDTNLASVFTPYTFYYNGNKSHCGANSFQLVKLDGVWKIHFLIDTKRKDECKDR